ncbi:BTAD domain-containing putative transcriptional regulator [Kribbella sp. CA-247076]|uniref:AfsR/SARP family transcriptional regulator n=1 Tax=Kribbella sp. CA-247076 TaxID=3239941 RepID=UPI003D930D16
MGHSNSPVRFGLFGGVRVIRAGVEIPVTQRKQRAILGLLLATPGETVGLSELVDELWPGEPAASVTNQIHRHIGALRRICEPQLVRREAGRYLLPAGTGYRLVAGPEESDVAQFRAAVRQARGLSEQGDRTASLRGFLDALEVAAAPAGDDRLRSLAAFVGLEDERVRAIVSAAELCAVAPEYAAMVPVLRTASTHHPLDESLHAHLVLALSAIGRTADALGVYREIRAALDRELGVGPGTLLEQAHAAALGDPRRGAPGAAGQRHSGETDRRPFVRVAPAQVPATVPGFVGRADVRRTFRDDLTRPSRLLLVTGMAGVGKTTLALQCAHDLADHFPDGQLFANLRGFDATAAPTAPLDALQDMLFGLGVPAQGLPDSLDARSALLRTLLADRRMLIVLDNAHDYQQVEPLLPGAGRHLVVITSRNSLPALVAFNQATPIELEPFDDDEVAEFFARRLADRHTADDREALIQLGQACGGLPLALAIVSARAVANPRFPLDLFVREFVNSDLRLPALAADGSGLDLSAVFSWSARGLSEDALHAFAVLSCHPGPSISVAASISLTGFDAGTTRAVLAELTAASVLRQLSPTAYAFHDLVREYALGLLGERRTDASTRLISHYVRSLANAIASFQQPSSGRADELPGIVAEEFSSSQAATSWYAEQRHILHSVCRLAMDLGQYQAALMIMLDWRPMSQAIDARHDMLPYADLAVAAAEQLSDETLRAEAYRDAASNLARTDQTDRARALFLRAAAAYEQAGDRLGLASVYRSMCVTMAMDPTERTTLLRRSVAIVREFGDKPTLASTMHALGLGYLWSGAYDDALVAFAEALALAESLPGMDHLQPHILSARARTLAKAGRFAEAARDAEPALEIFRREGAIHAELRLLHSYGEVLTALERPDAAADAWRRYLALVTGPEHIRETNALDDDTAGAETIKRIESRLATLTTTRQDVR